MNDGIYTCTICKRLRYSTLLHVLEESAEGLENLRKLGRLVCGYCEARAKMRAAEQAREA